MRKNVESPKNRYDIFIKFRRGISYEAKINV